MPENNEDNPLSPYKYAAYHTISGIVFVGAVFAAAMVIDRWKVLIAGAILASVLGILGRLLVHDELSVRIQAFTDLSPVQWCFVTYRIAAGCALAVAAAFLATSFLEPRTPHDDLAPVAVGFVVAYLFDVSKALAR